MIIISALIYIIIALLAAFIILSIVKLIIAIPVNIEKIVYILFLLLGILYAFSHQPLKL